MNKREQNVVLAQLRKHEGMRLKVYKDSLGNLTIGIGRLLSRGISAEEACYLAVNDIKDADTECWMNFPWYKDLSGDRKYAWTNLCFNMGITRLKGFKRAISAMEEGDYDLASAEIIDSKYARQVGRRANDIAEMIRLG